MAFEINNNVLLDAFYSRIQNALRSEYSSGSFLSSFRKYVWNNVDPKAKKTQCKSVMIKVYEIRTSPTDALIGRLIFSIVICSAQIYILAAG